jgi:prophage regulatory protein
MQNHTQGAAALPAEDLALVSIATVRQLVGLRDSAIYDRIRNLRMPAPLRLSGRCSRFRVGDVREYLRDPLGWSPEKAIDAPRSAA